MRASGGMGARPASEDCSSSGSGSGSTISSNSSSSSSSANSLYIYRRGSALVMQLLLCLPGRGTASVCRPAVGGGCRAVHRTTARGAHQTRGVCSCICSWHDNMGEDVTTQEGCLCASVCLRVELPVSQWFMGDGLATPQLLVIRALSLCTRLLVLGGRRGGDRESDLGHDELMSGARGDERAG